MSDGRSLDDRIDTRALVPLRIAVAPLVWLHLRPFLDLAGQGIGYRDRFWLPYAGWYPEVPDDIHTALLWTTAGAAVLVTVGFATRLAAWVTAAGVAYNLFLSQTHFHHNRAFLLILLVGVAVLPTGQHLSLDRRFGTPPMLSLGGGRRLALTVLRIEIAIVYLASGVSKLLDPAWFGGTVTRLRVVAGADRVPDALVGLLTDPAFHAIAAKVIVATEILIGAGLLLARSRVAAVWVALWFHVAIEVTADVQVFSLAAIAALVVWIGPEPRLAVTTPWPAALRMLDWTGRFAATRGSALTITDSSGAVHTGSRAAWRVATRLPITFPVAAPVAAIGTLRRNSRKDAG